MSEEMIETKDVVQEKPNEELKETTGRRGRPKKVELPETSLETIESIEEVKEEVEEIKEVIVEEIKKEKTEDVKDKVKKEELHKHYTASYDHRVGDTVYVAHFSSGDSGDLFGSILEKYIFRPFKTIVKEVLINSDNSISYRLDSCQGCFRENLITTKLEECERICANLNLRG